jgi:hypothetical protein
LAFGIFLLTQPQYRLSGEGTSTHYEIIQAVQNFLIDVGVKLAREMRG